MSSLLRRSCAGSAQVLGFRKPNTKTPRFCHSGHAEGTLPAEGFEVVVGVLTMVAWLVSVLVGELKASHSVTNRLILERLLDSGSWASFCCTT